MEVTASAFIHRELDETPRYPPNLEVFNPNPGYPGTEGTEFEGLTIAEVKDFLKKNMFIAARQLADGSWSGLFPLAYTLSVCCGIGEHNPYQYRWCFNDPDEAFKFFEEMETFDQVPESRNSLVGHRYKHTSRLLSTNNLGLRKW